MVLTEDVRMSSRPEESAARSESGNNQSLVRSIVMASIIGFGVVSFWRGVWYLWDVFTFVRPEDRLFSALASVTTGIVILSIMRTFYSVLAPPIARVNIRPDRTGQVKEPG
jgi:hypothetical protein